MRRLAFFSVLFAIVAVSFSGCSDTGPSDPELVGEREENQLFAITWAAKKETVSVRTYNCGEYMSGTAVFSYKIDKVDAFGDPSGGGPGPHKYVNHFSERGELTGETSGYTWKYSYAGKFGWHYHGPDSPWNPKHFTETYTFRLVGQDGAPNYRSHVTDQYVVTPDGSVRRDRRKWYVAECGERPEHGQN